MPGARYFLSLGGSFLLGAAVIIISIIATWLLLPYLVPLAAAIFPSFVGAVLVIIAFIIVVVIVYVCTLIGVFIQYLFKTAEVSKDATKGYGIGSAKEAGLRERGKSNQKNTDKKKEENDKEDGK